MSDNIKEVSTLSYEIPDLDDPNVKKVGEGVYSAGVVQFASSGASLGIYRPEGRP